MASAQTSPDRIDLEPGVWVDYHAGWLAAGIATDLQAELTEGLEWEQKTIVLFGKQVMQPRLIAWFGTVAYRYSGRTLPARPPPETILRLMKAASRTTAVPFNHVLINRYRDGQDSMGWHSDDEPELGSGPQVASLSLGATRRFVLKRKRPKAAEPLSLELAHGSLLVMRGDCQHVYRHRVPKQAAASGERINLTFRRVLREPPP